MAQLLSGWGRTAPSAADVRAPASGDELAALLRDPPARGVLARGLGRAYGDAAQNAGGAVVDMTALAGIEAFDEATGTVTVRAGTSLGDLIDHVLPRGWFPAVVPGTRHVTVGGAIAADIHGKNHHVDGAFCSHVDSMELLTPDGERRTLTPGEDAFAATAGGMGLTGIVLSATLRLRPAETDWMIVDTERASDLDDLLARMRSGDADHRYSVAWIDCLARGRALGRGVLMRGEHATRAALPEPREATALPGPRLAAPGWAPNGLLRPATVAAFNEVYFRAARTAQGHPERLAPYFFPLDAVRDWNRLYGSRGFLQYQCLVPFGAEDVLRAVIERLRAARAPSLLSVLKAMGPGRGLLSFPAPGWTLAMDLAAAPRLVAVLDELDELVAGVGGRVYLAKDSRLRPELLAAMYPELGRWESIRAGLDPAGVMRSDLARRIGLGG